ncbi:hypothetical protein BpHYR1_009147 [Brachionus plicatilis]|uniref:Uncharacterized protein n=1 Tax=Brachionus plicatilis TaxID=10195 RepID=A0A3M7RL48_BRAPC|nr:hypothetical protein BpHYR1_009147 [Brachionus plicatilis]
MAAKFLKGAFKDSDVMKRFLRVLVNPILSSLDSIISEEKLVSIEYDLKFYIIHLFKIKNDFRDNIKTNFQKKLKVEKKMLLN